MGNRERIRSLHKVLFSGLVRESIRNIENLRFKSEEGLKQFQRTAHYKVRQAKQVVATCLMSMQC